MQYLFHNDGLMHAYINFYLNLAIFVFGESED